MKSKLELKNIAAMVTDGVVSVRCSFTGNPGSRTYTYKCKVELAKQLKEGDRVVVQSRDKPGAVVIVVDIDPMCILDDPKNIDYLWIYQKVDDDALSNLLDWEDNVIDFLHKKQRIKQQQEILEALDVEADDIKISIPDMKETKDA